MSRQTTIILYGIVIPIFIGLLVTLGIKAGYGQFKTKLETRIALYNEDKNAAELIDNTAKENAFAQKIITEYTDFWSIPAVERASKLTENVHSIYGKISVLSATAGASAETVKLELAGYSGSILELVEFLENSSKFFSIDSISFKAAPKGNSLPLLVSMTLSALKTPEIKIEAGKEKK